MEGLNMSSLVSRLCKLQKVHDQFIGEASKSFGIALIQKEGKLYDYDSEQEKYIEWIEPPNADKKYSQIIIIPHNYREPFPT